MHSTLPPGADILPSPYLHGSRLAYCTAMSITEQPASGEAKIRRRRWVLPAAIGAAVVVVAVVITAVVVLNARPSLQSVSDDCGGTNAGIVVAGDGLVVNPRTATAATLVCVTRKLLPDLKDQFQVTHAVDSGTRTELRLNGYAITVIPVEGVGSTVGFEAP